MSDEAAFCHAVDVSRETLARLETYESLLKKWNARINLVSPRTIDQIWTRHFLDSAQVFSLAEGQSGVWLDLGSGGGFPGLIVAVLAAEKNPDLRIVLVESDKRKAAFLLTAASAMKLDVVVRSERIEFLDPAGANILSARALAPLEQLLPFASRHLREDGFCLFPKGLKWRDEVEKAKTSWVFDCQSIQSLTDPDAVILKIQGMRHA